MCYLMLDSGFFKFHLAMDQLLSLFFLAYVLCCLMSCPHIFVFHGTAFFFKFVVVSIMFRFICMLFARDTEVRILPALKSGT